jgi:hypothetical protein
MDNPSLSTHASGARTAPTTNSLGARTAPTNAPPSDALRSDGTNVVARIDDSHLSACTDASHLSVCTAETQLSSITEDSMLAPNLHLSGNPTWESGDVPLYLAIGRTPSAVRIDCATVGYETQRRPPVTGCQLKSSYSNNNDNPVTHKS